MNKPTQPTSIQSDNPPSVRTTIEQQQSRGETVSPNETHSGHSTSRPHHSPSAKPDTKHQPGQLASAGRPRTDSLIEPTIAQPRRVDSGFARSVFQWSRAAITLAVLVALVYVAYRYFLPAKTGALDSVTHVVQRRTVTDTVIERGTLESQNNFIGRCKLPGWENKIIFIVPEGKAVKKDEIVVKFDSAATDKLIAEKKIALNEAESKLEQQKQEAEVQKNKSESDIATANLELTLARLDLEKYRDGDFKAESRDLERGIAEGEAELEKVSEELGNVRALVKKGFRSPEQLREFELRAKFRQFQLDRDKQKYMVLMKYDFKRKITDFEAKSIEGERKLVRAKTTSAAETQKHASLIISAANAVEMQTASLKELEETLAQCEIKAPQDGTVAYANQPWFDQQERIREGATIRREQDIFYLPDMAKMQVKVQIHESVINKVKTEQIANVRVDAFPDVVFTGKVLSVASLATSSFSDAKNYDAVVLIEKIPEDVAAKPGMTAQVEVFIGEYADIIALPVTAVTEHFKQSYVYVVKGSNVERRAVAVGRSTHSFVEIKSGLEAGEVVALDAYQRGLADFASAEQEAESKTPTPVVPPAAKAPPAKAPPAEAPPSAAPPAEAPPAAAPPAEATLSDEELSKIE